MVIRLPNDICYNCGKLNPRTVMQISVHYSYEDGFKRRDHLDDLAKNKLDCVIPYKLMSNKHGIVINELWCTECIKKEDT